MITPNEIETKEFTSTKGGGYKGEEVDQFLDEILVDYTSLLEERNALKNKVALLTDRLNGAAASAPTPAPAPAAPAPAPQSPSEELSAARKKAERLVAEAEDYAKKLIETAQAEANRQNAINQKLSSEIEQFKTSLIDAYTNHIKLVQELPKMDLADVTVGSERLEVLNESFGSTSIVGQSPSAVAVDPVPAFDEEFSAQKTVYSEPDDTISYGGKRGKASGSALSESDSNILRDLFDEEQNGLRKNKKVEKKKKKLFFKDDDDDDDYFDDEED